MTGYTKLFGSILASTIWREDMETRIVWITLLAMADKRGVAEASVPGLADFARVSIDGTRAALAKLMAPDPDSRSQAHEGRRIEAVDGGWRLLNHAAYRAKMNEDDRREYRRQKQAEYRQRGRGVDSALTGVDNRGHSWTGVDTVDTNININRSKEQEPPSRGHGVDNVDKTVDAECARDPADALQWFFDSYPRWYAEERHGARYLPQPAMDGPAAQRLVQAWPDRSHLEAMARCYLRSTKLDGFHNSRSIDKFLREASGIDAFLRQEGLAS